MIIVFGFITKKNKLKRFKSLSLYSAFFRNTVPVGRGCFRRRYGYPTPRIYSQGNFLETWIDTKLRSSRTHTRSKPIVGLSPTTFSKPQDRNCFATPVRLSFSTLTSLPSLTPGECSASFILEHVQVLIILETSGQS